MTTMNIRGLLDMLSNYKLSRRILKFVFGPVFEFLMLRLLPYLQVAMLCLRSCREHCQGNGTVTELRAVRIAVHWTNVTISG
jgi:hypothetical protein